MYTLWKLGQDSFTVKVGARTLLAEGTYEEAVRVMLIDGNLPGTEIMRAQAALDLSGDNVAHFGPDKRFDTTRRASLAN